MCSNIKSVENCHKDCHNHGEKCGHKDKCKNNINAHNHKHNHCHEHNHNHCHTHSHGGKFPVIMYFVGLAAFIVGYILENSYSLYSNILFIGTVGIAGYHVIFEGLGNTIRDSKKKKDFLLMFIC